MENYISMVIRDHSLYYYGGKQNWVIVQNVELEIKHQRRHGKWLVVQINKENECN
jgi:hypothetical protein